METDFSRQLTSFGENFIDVINKMKLRNKLTLAEQRELIKILLIENYKYIGSNLHSLITEVSTNSKLSNREKLKYANDLQEFLNDKKYHFYFSHEIANLYYSFASNEGKNTFNILLDTNNGDFENYEDIQKSLDEIESQIELNYFYKEIIKNIKWNFNLKVIHQLQPISLKKKLKKSSFENNLIDFSSPIFDDFNESNIKSENDKNSTDNNKIKEPEISFDLKYEDITKFKSVLKELFFKINLVKNLEQIDSLYKLLASKDFTKENEKINLNCETKEFAFVLQLLMPYFGKLTYINIEKTKLIFTKKNNLLLANNISQQAITEPKSNEKIRQIISKM